MSQDQVYAVAAPILILVVGFFLSRFIKSADKTQGETFELRLKLEILKKDLEAQSGEIAVLKRDQASMWRKIDLIRRESADGITIHKSRQ